MQDRDNDQKYYRSNYAGDAVNTHSKTDPEDEPQEKAKRTIKNPAPASSTKTNPDQPENGREISDYTGRRAQPKGDEGRDNGAHSTEFGTTDNATFTDKASYGDKNQTKRPVSREETQETPGKGSATTRKFENTTRKTENRNSVGQLQGTSIRSRSKIGMGTAVTMIGVSLFFDVIQFLLSFIPIVGWIINIGLDGVAFFVFWLWFKVNRVSFFSGKGFGKRLLGLIGGAVLDMVPLIDGIAWTLAVGNVIALVWAEERAPMLMK